MMYADIIVDITNEKLDKIFQYSIPGKLEGKLQIGEEVLVPFGKGNKEKRAYIVGFSDQPGYDPGKIKEILSVPEKGIGIEAKLVALAAWMKENYGGTMIQALKTVLPIKKKENTLEKKMLILLLDRKSGQEKLEYYRKKNQKARARLLEALLKNPRLDYGGIREPLHLTWTVVQSLEEAGVLSVETSRIYRNPVRQKADPGTVPHYTKEQEQAIRSFSRDYDAGKRRTYLLYGVTGSGKTEVYMAMIRKVVDDGRQAIVLIPEIALTYQTVERFQRMFGDRVSVLNSRMSAGERYDQMNRAKEGEIDVMIGPRSALFTPFPDLGLIVMDEEHESSYKSEQVPRYHARETAAKRAELEGAGLVLGSATPSMEAFYRCRKGEYTLLRLSERICHRPLPQVQVADMRQELRGGNRSIFSDRLRQLMEDRLERKEQTMLFINRRGYAGFISCRSCGHVMKCPHCDVSLSAHRGGKLVCHYCGYETPAVKRCPVCGSPYIGGFKAGTQQIEELAKQAFPAARILRMDADTTRRKDAHARILEAFGEGEADILVGTQMIVKGHDFPKVTLVGVLAADLSLYSDDYRCGERTFQLLAQAAGRAGRGEAKGEVVIQTYSPEHYSIQAAARQDYEGFYEEEIRYRQMMGYPPAAHLLAVLFAGENEEYLETAAVYLKEFISRLDRGGSLCVIGPASPYVGKVKDVYRKILYLKCEKYDMLVKAKDRMERYIEANTGYRDIRIQFDFDPMNLF